MEQGLLELEFGDPDIEEINTIFRAAHSIKGGSGTFGFDEVTSFTHVLETLLDEMRSLTRNVSDEAVNLLLESVDILRDMFTAWQEKEPVDKVRAAEVQAKLEALMKGSSAVAPPPAVAEAPVAPDVSAQEGKDSSIVTGWKIQFIPHDHMLMTGNEPVRMFRELEGLGELSAVLNADNLPKFDQLDPEACYVFWNMTLIGDVSKDQVLEVFEWVDEDCELNLEPIVSGAGVSQGVSSEGVVAESSAAPSSVETKAEVAPIVARKAARKKDTNKQMNSIRVDIDKIDILINMVGELVITQSMLSQIGGSDEEFTEDRIERMTDGLDQLERNTRELQESVMRIRMLPISFVFSRFPRMVHDLGQKLEKKIELKLYGEQTEMDKTVMERIGDPLVHLVRNSIDHGIERPATRLAQGKPESGVVELDAYHQGGSIVIEIRDDGAGLNKERIVAKAVENGLLSEGESLSDEEVNDLIFQAGFSTAESLSDVSGRGVGMDVVRKNIKALNGSVGVTSTQGKGSVFTIRLPLTLAILDGQLIRVGEYIYILPLVSIIESIQVIQEHINAIAGKAELYKLRDEYIPIIRLYETFNVTPDQAQLEDGLLVIVEGDGRKVGLFVDELLGQQQVVIKSLKTNYRDVEGVSGATILGDGTVALILDVPGIIQFSQHRMAVVHASLFQMGHEGDPLH
jgi:two-component system chemotaxis sensor kinase CheA